MLSAILHPEPVIYLEHKLLAHEWLEAVGTGGRGSISFDVPKAGARGDVPIRWAPIDLGSAALRRDGDDLALISVGVGVHRALQAAAVLEREGTTVQVLDLRSISPLDTAAVRRAAEGTGRVVVVDEDNLEFGLSGEIAALLLESGIAARFARVCTTGTIPYSFGREREVLPNADRILKAARSLLDP
jgi:pyruvate dehydrogenase E1 component beta subunit